MQYASSNSSEESCGAHFDRPVALIEGVRPSGTTVEAKETVPKESESEPMIINTAPPLGPSPQAPTDETSESPMEEETSEPAGLKTQTMPPVSSLSPSTRFLEAPITPTR